MIVKEQRIIRQRRHGNANLRQIVQVLENGYLAQQQTVRYVLGHQEAADEMLDWAGFAAMRTQHECIETAFPDGWKIERI